MCTRLSPFHDLFTHGTRYSLSIPPDQVIAATAKAFCSTPRGPQDFARKTTRRSYFRAGHAYDDYHLFTLSTRSRLPFSDTPDIRGDWRGRGTRSCAAWHAEIAWASAQTGHRDTRRRTRDDLWTGKSSTCMTEQNNVVPWCYAMWTGAGHWTTP